VLRSGGSPTPARDDERESTAAPSCDRSRTRSRRNRHFRLSCGCVYRSSSGLGSGLGGQIIEARRDHADEAGLSLPAGPHGQPSTHRTVAGAGCAALELAAERSRASHPPRLTATGRRRSATCVLCIKPRRRLGADLVAAFVRLGKRSSRGSAQTSWLLRTRSGHLTGPAGVAAAGGKGQSRSRGCLGDKDGMNGR
jgi:hypothetical protein